MASRVALSLPPLAVLAVLVAWAAEDGGYPPTVWYPGAIFLLALLVVVLLAYPAVARALPRPTALALGLFAAFVAWAYLSIAWADVPGDAWAGASRTLLYLTVFALLALWPWRAAGAAVWLGLFAVVVGIIGLAVFLANGDAFLDGRLAEPTGYSNATCALFLIPFWPAVLLASRRETPAPARAILLAAAGVLFELALLTQSRGFLFAFPLVLALYLAVVPGRLRSLVALAPLAVAVLLSLRPLLDVYAADGDEAALRDARLALLLSAGGLLVAGTLLGVLDGRFAMSERATRIAARALVGAGLAGIVIGLSVGFLVVDRPGERLSDAWTEFKSGEPREFGSSHFTGGGLGSGRYDEWRVALGEFRSAPLHGIGMDNFAVPYLRERETSLEPRYPHSFPLAVLSQTGIVGALLLLGFLAAALAAGARSTKRAEPLGAGIAGAALVAFAYWLVHGAADWFWEFPGLGAAAFACLGLAAGLGRPPPPPVPPLRRALRLGAAVTGAVLALAALASYTAPWLAARELRSAADEWRVDAPGAFSRLDRARRLNPLSDRPDLLAGAIAMRLEDYERARAAFERVLERNPRNWYAYLELAMIEALAGERAAALARLDKAQALNPSEDTIQIVRGWITEGEPVEPREIDELLLERLESRTGLRVTRDG